MDLSSNVADISCGGYACVARFTDGSATAWGSQHNGGDLTDTDSGRVVDLSSNVADISCGNYESVMCVARFTDGSATAWGDQNNGPRQTPACLNTSKVLDHAKKIHDQHIHRFRQCLCLHE